MAWEEEEELRMLLRPPMLKLLFPVNHPAMLRGITAGCPELVNRVERGKLNAVETLRFVDNVGN